MNLQQFCIEYGMPLTRTSRSVRERAVETLAEVHDLPGDRRDEIDLEAYGVDQVVGDFLRITKPEGQRRFSYEVIDPDGLARWLRNKHGADLLTERDLSLLLDFAEQFRRAVYGEGNWKLRSQDGSRYNPDYGPFKRLERILLRAGRIQDSDEL
jgi:hypothetical protein